MKSAIIIPARYGSSRFPGKPLAIIAGKTMIRRVYERSLKSKADTVIVATDDQRIADEVASFGGIAMMTSASCQSGTDRIAEVAEKIGDIDTIINVQGDEPLMPSCVIDQLIDLMKNDRTVEMATVAVPATRKNMTSDNVKVVFGADGNALYFSRCDIPFVRQGGIEAPMYLHWGIYAYRSDILRRFVSLPPSVLEQSEKLEQLRALENGIKIKVICSNLESIGIDTPDDLKRAEKKLAEFDKNECN